jgi:hypothetical protein
MAEQQGSKVVITIDRPGHVTQVEVKFDDALSHKEIAALAEAMRDVVKAVRLCSASKRQRTAEPDAEPEVKINDGGRDTCPTPDVARST